MNRSECLVFERVSHFSVPFLKVLACLDSQSSVGFFVDFLEDPRWCLSLFNLKLSQNL